MNLSQFEYFAFHFVVLSVPLLIVLFHKNSSLRPFVKQACIAIVLTALPFILWDSLAVTQGHWEFNPRYITGIMIGNLPLEEILFFFTVTFACLHVWAELNSFTTWSDMWKRFKDFR